MCLKVLLQKRYIIRQGIYIDTSVMSSYIDDEFKVATRLLFERIKDGGFVIYFFINNKSYFFNESALILIIVNEYAGLS